MDPADPQGGGVSGFPPPIPINTQPDTPQVPSPATQPTSEDAPFSAPPEPLQPQMTALPPTPTPNMADSFEATSPQPAPEAPQVPQTFAFPETSASSPLTNAQANNTATSGLPPMSELASFPQPTPVSGVLPQTIPPETPAPNPFMPSPSSEPPSQGKKKWPLLILVGVLLIGTIGGGIFLASRFTPQFSENAPTTQTTPAPTQVVASAKVASLEGTARSVLHGAPIQLTKDQSIPEGSLIETEEDAKVLLVFEGGSILRIGPASRVTLTSLAPRAPVITQETGATYAYVESTTLDTFTVDSGDVTIDTPGAAFSVERDEVVLVNVFQNKVKVTEEDMELEVAEGQRFIQGNDAGTPFDISQFATDNFLQWSIEEELNRIEVGISSSEVVAPSTEAYKTALEALDVEKKEAIKTAYQASKEGTLTKITLTGQKTADGAVSLTWTPDGLAQEGYKVIWSTTPKAEYPGEKRTSEPILGYLRTLVPMANGQTWYYRVCEWTGTTCGVYSNEISLNF